MKYLKLYENFKEEDIHAICKKYNIKNYTINNGVVDVDGDVYFSDKSLSELPLKFGVVSGSFDCGYCSLTSLNGSPIEVGVDFYCNYNRLTSLEGAPEIVGDVFSCTHNNIKTLKGSLKKAYNLFCNNNKLTNLEGYPEVDTTFFCNDNLLTTLKGGPEYVNGYFDCQYNKLTNLEGCPKEISESFMCHNNLLTSLKGCPDLITHMDCSNNKLTTLEGAPKEITGNFYCNYNLLTTLEGAPEKISGNFIFYRNPIENVCKLFPDYESYVDSLEYGYFRGGNKINKIRLTHALKEFGLECPDNVKGYEYE